MRSSVIFTSRAVVAHSALTGISKSIKQTAPSRFQRTRSLKHRAITPHKAMVPIIPPHLRPADALSNYYILSEAHWSPEPPRDPFLLKRIDGFLFAVLAAWDLTEIERAVLGTIRRPEM